MNGGPEPWTIAAADNHRGCTTERRQPGPLAGQAALLLGGGGEGP